MWRSFSIRIDNFLLICPFCDQNFGTLADCFEHVLEHFTLDKLYQAKLIRWLSLKSYRNVDHIEPQALVKSHEFVVHLPVINNHTKCVFCEKFVVNNIMNHLFDHFQIFNRRSLIEMWFRKFLLTDQSYYIVQSSCNYINTLKTLPIDASNLLEQLAMFENQRSNTCRYCGTTTNEPALLYDHYVEWHCDLPVKFFNCFVCNFKVKNDNDFLVHVYERHLKCICGQKFRNFMRCLQHVESCLLQPIGLYCPMCRNQNVQFTNEGILLNHILNTCNPSTAKNEEQSDDFVNFSDIQEFLSDEQNLQIKLEMQNV